MEHDVNAGDDYSFLKEDELQEIYKVFISKETGSEVAVKWRLYQFLMVSRQFDIQSAQVNQFVESEEDVDFIIEDHNHNIVLFIVFGILDSDKFNTALTNISNFVKSHEIDPDRIIFVASKSYRNIPLKNPIELGEKAIEPELWVEWSDNEIPFNSEDLLIVNNNELTIAGFNFSRMTDLLDYIYRYSSGGEITIYRKRGFFSENIKEPPKPDLIWKGVMMKNNN